MKNLRSSVQKKSYRWHFIGSLSSVVQHKETWMRPSDETGFCTNGNEQGNIKNTKALEDTGGSILLSRPTLFLMHQTMLIDNYDHHSNPSTFWSTFHCYCGQSVLKSCSAFSTLSFSSLWTHTDKRLQHGGHMISLHSLSRTLTDIELFLLQHSGVLQWVPSVIIIHNTANKNKYFIRPF